MKSFRSLIFLSVFFFSLSFSISNTVSAGTLDVTLGADGKAYLNADFNDDFNCVPEGLHKYVIISELMGCYSVSAEDWSVSG